MLYNESKHTILIALVGKAQKKSISLLHWLMGMDSDDDPKGLLFLREAIRIFFSVVEWQVPHYNLFCLPPEGREYILKRKCHLLWAF